MRLIIFDMDGTLIDSQALIVEAMKAAFTAEGIAPPDTANIRSIIGLSLPNAMAELHPGASTEQITGLTAAYKAHFVALRERNGGEASLRLYPGVRALLDELKAEPETLLGVATGKARRGLDHVYAAHDLGGYFVTSQTADLHPSKPHPAMLEAALADTGIAAENAVMIGDTSFDMEMAKAAGLHAIGVAWGYHDTVRLKSAGAVEIAEDTKTLGRLLKSWSI